MGRLVEKTRCSGTKSEAAFRAMIVSALRKLNMYWKPISECKKNARVSRGLYKCNICKKITRKGNVDHITPIVPVQGFTTWDEYINNMFCEIDGLQFLCEKCHDEKTLLENKKRKENKK